MNDSAKSEVPLVSQPMLGVRLYSPGTLAAFTALFSLPIGFVLYGLNVRARGGRRLGLSMVSFGVLLQVLFLLLGARDSFPSGSLLVIGLFGALNVYKLESRPFALALTHGATKAPWWPPALAVLSLTALLLAVSLAASVLL